MAKDISVRLDANVSAYIAGFRQAAAATRDLASQSGATAREIRRAQSAIARDAVKGAAAQKAAYAAAAAQQQQHGAALTAQLTKGKAAFGQIGAAAGKAGVAGAVGLGLMAKAAINWEQDWTGVTKTVNGTDAEMANLQQGLRDLAKTMPSTTHEIAGVAEAAGALGVKGKDILGFTKTMLDLGNTTNLSAEEAATSLAQFMGIMGTAPSQVSNLGSALVGLGNNGASTESQILGLSLRLAGAGKTISLTESDIMGFSSALTSLGLPVETAGTNMSKSFTRIGNAVRAGGDELDVFAQTAGVSAQTFADQFKTAPAAAINSFVEGLGRIMKAGGDVDGILTSVGITSQREKDNFLRLAGASKAASTGVNSLGTALGSSKKFFKDNAALAQEATKRYQTAGSQIQIAMNKIKDAAITGGAALAPALTDAANAIGDLATAFGAMSSSDQKFAVQTAVAVTAALLLAGAVVKIAAAGAVFEAAMGGIAASSVIGAGAVAALGTAAVVAGIALAGAFVFAKLDKHFSGSFTPSVEAATKSILDLSKTTVDPQKIFKFTEFDDINKAMHGDITSLNDGLVRLSQNNVGDSIGEQYDKMAGTSKSATGQFKAMMHAYDEGFISLGAAGQGAAAAETFTRLATSVQDSKGSMTDLVAQFPAYAAQVKRAAEANGNAVTTTEQLVTLMSGGLPAGFKGTAVAAGGAAAGTKKVATEAQKAEAALRKTAAAAITASSALLQLQGGEIAVAGAALAMKDALKQNGKHLDINTVKGNNNQQALHAYASTAIDFAKFQSTDGVTSQEKVNDTLRHSRNVYANMRHDMGDSTKHAEKLATKLFGLGRTKAEPKIVVPSGDALKKVDLTAAAFKKLPKKVESKISALLAKGKFDEAKRLLENLDKTKAKPTVEPKGVPKAKKAAKETQTAFEKAGKVHAKPIIKIPSASAKAMARDTEKAVKAAGKAHAKPKITSPGRKAKQDADETKKSYDKAGKAHAKPKLTSPGKKAKQDADQTAASYKRLGGITATPRIKASSNAGSVANSAQRSINSVHGKSVTISVHTVKSTTGKKDGGPVFSSGGAVWGAGTATSDSIDAKLSNGEYVVKQKSTAKYGLGAMAAVNDGRAEIKYAAGGPVGFAAGGAVDFGTIRALIAAFSNPIGSILAAMKVVATATANLARENRVIAKPKATLDAAVRAKDAAIAKRNAANAEVVRLRAKGPSKALDAAVQRQREANLAVQSTTLAKTKAQQAYDKVAVKAKAAAEKLAEANKVLAERQQAVSETARGVAASFAAAYTEADFTDPRDVLARKQEGAVELAKLTAKITALRNAGLNDTQVQEVIDKGAIGGVEMADSILKGGKAMVDALNLAQKKLDEAANALGLNAATGNIKKAGGGWVNGPGTGTSDSVPILASNREFVVNAASAALNGPLLEAINNSSRSVISRQFATAFSGISGSTSAAGRAGQSGATIHQHFPTSADPRAAASAAGGRVVAALSAIGV